MDVFFEGLKELAAVSKPHSAQFMVVSFFLASVSAVFTAGARSMERGR